MGRSRHQEGLHVWGKRSCLQQLKRHTTLLRQLVLQFVGCRSPCSDRAQKERSQQVHGKCYSNIFSFAQTQKSVITGMHERDQLQKLLFLRLVCKCNASCFQLCFQDNPRIRAVCVCNSGTQLENHPELSEDRAITVLDNVVCRTCSALLAIFWWNTLERIYFAR